MSILPAMMLTSSSLCLAFLKAAARADLGPSPALADCLREGLLTGEQRWPGVSLGAERFGDYLGRLAADTEPAADADAFAAALRSWNLGDLYLAAACVSGIASALCLFDEHILRQVPAFVLRLRLSPAQVDEVRQALREKLLFGEAGSGPKIAAYKGQASLVSFVRVAAVRAALNLRRSKDEQLQPDGGDRLAQVLATTKSDPELEYIRSRYRDEFLAAMRTAFATLADEQRNILHMYFVEGLNTRQLAKLFQVNATTASRWVAGARAHIGETARRLLREQLHVTDAEIQSIYRVLHSQLDLSIRALLQQGAQEGRWTPPA